MGSSTWNLQRGTHLGSQWAHPGFTCEIRTRINIVDPSNEMLPRMSPPSAIQEDSCIVRNSFVTLEVIVRCFSCPFRGAPHRAATGNDRTFSVLTVPKKMSWNVLNYLFVPVPAIHIPTIAQLVRACDCRVAGITGSLVRIRVVGLLLFF